MVLRTPPQARGTLAASLLLLAALVIGMTQTAGAYTSRCPNVSYRSAPTLHAENVCENLGVSTHGTEPGTYLFLSPDGANGAGAGIYQDTGTLVWWLSTHSAKDHDLTVVQFRGQSYIALWTGRPATNGSYGSGSVTLYDKHYQVAGHITIGRAYHANGIDLHEFQITPEGDALIGSYTPIHMKVGDHYETVLGYLVEKWSLTQDSSGIHTNRLLFAWNAVNDVPLSASHYADPGPNQVWDYFHGNGITEAPNGNLLVSARNTWGIYELNTRRGTRGFDHIYWQVGAAHDHHLTHPWCYQHDIGALGHGLYSLYDDGGVGPGCMPGAGQHPARGVIFRVDSSTRPVRIRLIRSYLHTPRIYTGFTGSTQVLDNGDVLIDWANIPEVSEYDSSGQDVKMDLSLSAWSYRGFRFAWDGEPVQPPTMASQRTSTGTSVWASWNGSTEVTAWQVLGGPDSQHLAPVGGPFAKTGFETAMSISGQYATLAVQALGSNGAVLATSAPASG